MLLQAAGTIHTDFERGFICAEVMHYEELHELGSEHAVKAAGKYRQEGKNYTVADGDIIFFVSAVLHQHSILSMSCRLIVDCGDNVVSTG
jgi:ribosome-binding ATPase YchF (GTP1/OBG family)